MLRYIKQLIIFYFQKKQNHNNHKLDNFSAPRMNDFADFGVSSSELVEIFKKMNP